MRVSQNPLNHTSLLLPHPYHPQALLSQNFLGGQDEEWFRLVYVATEAGAGGAVAQAAAAEVCHVAMPSSSVQRLLGGRTWGFGRYGVGGR